MRHYKSGPYVIQKRQKSDMKILILATTSTITTTTTTTDRYSRLSRNVASNKWRNIHMQTNGFLVNSADYHPEEELFPEGYAPGK